MLNVDPISSCRLGGNAQITYIVNVCPSQQAFALDSALSVVPSLEQTFYLWDLCLHFVVCESGMHPDVLLLRR
jgi:hypothetical protein